MTKSSGFRDMIESCEIFARRDDEQEGGSYSLFAADHDIIWVNISPAKFTDEEIARLEELGWHSNLPDQDGVYDEETAKGAVYDWDCFHSYRYA